MKQALAAMIILWMLAPHAAVAGTFEVDGFIEDVSRKALNRLPKMAGDGLLETHRGKANWKYSFYTRIDKVYRDEVRVTLKQINAFRTLVTVETVRVYDGILWRTTDDNPDETPKWEQRIKEALTSSSGMND